MGRNTVIVAAAAVAIVIYVAFGAALGRYLDPAALGLWGAPGVETEVEVLEPVAVRAALADLGQQPVPGAEAEAEEPPTLGQLAGAGARCTVERTGGAPPPQAEEALRRYLLMLGAVAAAPEHPLLEPEFRDLTPLFARGPGEVRRSLTEGDLSAREQALLAGFDAAYRQGRHPLYRDLGLHADTFPELSFQALLDTVREQPEAVADCAFAAVMGRGGTLPRREVPWTCVRDGEAFSLVSTVRSGDPPVLTLAREGRSEEAARVGTDEGERFEGAGWAFRSTDDGAVLDLPDGTTAACTPGEAG